MNIFVSAFFLLALVSCVGEKSSLRFNAPGMEERQSGLTEEQAMAFSDIQTKVLVPAKCLNCHATFNTVKGLAPHFKAGNPEASKLFTEVESGSMPMGEAPLTTAQLEVVRNYINSFDTTSTPAPSPTPDHDDEDEDEDEDDDDHQPVPVPEPEAVTFKKIQDQILIPSCIKCHSKQVSEETLLKWIDQENPLNSKFLRVVENGSMPKGGPVLSPEKQELIRKYLSKF